MAKPSPLQRIGPIQPICLIGLLCFGGFCQTLSGAVLRLDGDRVTLRAEQESLRDVLAEFVRTGVEVRIDPGVDARANGVLEDEDINDALEKLLGHFNYLLFWDVIEGPVGSLPRLAGIHVFRAGRQQEVVPFDPVGNNHVVVRLPGVPAHAKDELLLGLRPGTTAAQFRELLASVGGTVVASVPEFGIYQVRLPRDSNVLKTVDTLGGNPWVAVAEPNYIHQVPTPLQAANPGGTANPVRSPPAPSQGGAAVAIFDSGLTELNELGSAVVGTFDAVDPSRSIADPLGHGTQMALIASGAVVPGGAPFDAATDSVPVLAIRSFDDNGAASNFSLLRGINYAIDQGGRVISMSWGTETDSDFLENAIRYAQEQGMVVVASAGNVPNNRPTYPAAYSRVLGVSALNPDGTVWEKSNYGDFVFLGAPGTAEFPIGYNGPPGSYAGTSISSPYVASVISQYIAIHPEVSSEQAVDALREALTDVGEPGKDPHFGHGVLDAAALEQYLKKP